MSRAVPKCKYEETGNSIQNVQKTRIYSNKGGLLYTSHKNASVEGLQSKGLEVL